ncbi:MAG: hypothetical protein M1819_003220 [Sarea resinae]|nr:MAG: hypothetical protein M1819_003220 [Sarea resinae]
MASLKAAKKELRQQIRRALQDISAESVASQSQTVSSIILSSPEYQAARRISIYLSMPAGEINTAPIVHDALRNGKRVFIPYTHRIASPSQGQSVSVMDMLSLHSVADYDSFAPDSWGIPIPSDDSIAVRANCLGATRLEDQRVGTGVGQGGLDMIVMPGMAFDNELGRLGHGKGYYDRFLQFYQETRKEKDGENARMPFLVGLALQEQLLPDHELVPTDPTDRRLDALAVGDGTLRRAKT